MRKNQWFKWFIIEIDKTIQQAADGRVCLRKRLTKNGLLLLDKTRFLFQIASNQGITTEAVGSGRLITVGGTLTLETALENDFEEYNGS